MSETFLTYRGNRWLWVSIISAGLLVLSYVEYSTRMAPHGGTFMGLCYGVLGTIAILVLMSLGIRKRCYSSGLGTLQGWTSAHVYLGLLTLLVIPMHAGFRFGLDIHTLAFALLFIVVISGILGVILYQTIPSRLTKYDAGLQADKVDQEINRLLAEMRNLARDKSDAFVKVFRDEMAQATDLKPKGWRLLFAGAGRDLMTKRAEELTQRVTQVPSHEHQAFETLSRLLFQKSQLETNLMFQMRLRNALEAWLYVHLPVSFAMVAAVLVHLLAVFYY